MTTSYLRLLKFTLLLAALLPVILAICSALMLESTSSSIGYTILAYVVLGFLPLCILVEYSFKRITGFVDLASQDQAGFLDQISSRYADLAIAASAGLALFLELAVIRWQGEDIPLFAFYKNFSLLACFAGLGLGYALATLESIPLILTIPVLSFQMLLLAIIRHGAGGDWIRPIWNLPFVEQLHMGLAPTTSVENTIATYFFLTVFFLLTVLAFIPIGQLCGRLMTRQEKLRSYGLNLLGSILGVLLVMGTSLLWVPPVIWFGLCFACLLFF
ncbi:MAG: hypothetical protein HY912_19605, partial [Desulfomonile tiedjei]|nr:hypothetical protein [Desulfomonile tiedjei]